MAADPKYDIAMLFVDKSGTYVWAESDLAVAESDPLMTDFSPVSSYQEYSSFFEVSNFNFAVALKPQDQGIGSMSRSNQSGAGGGSPSSGDQFTRWRSAKESEYRKIRFPLEFDTFTFTRFIDGASPVFFDACCNQNSFTRAALVKRLQSPGLGDASGLAFVRLDFTDVLMTGISWDDGDLVSETCTFICKRLLVTYRQQFADGTMGTLRTAQWDQVKDGSAAASDTGGM